MIDDGEEEREGEGSTDIKCKKLNCKEEKEEECLVMLLLMLLLLVFELAMSLYHDDITTQYCLTYKGEKYGKSSHLLHMLYCSKEAVSICDSSPLDLVGVLVRKKGGEGGREGGRRRRRAKKLLFPPLSLFERAHKFPHSHNFSSSAHAFREKK